MRKIGLFGTLSVLMLFIPYVCWGRKDRVLIPSKPLNQQLTIARATYIVKDVFDLQGETLFIPIDAILNFEEGGAFKNGLIVFNNTKLEGVPSILCKIDGTIRNKELYVDWFVRNNDLDFLNAAGFYDFASGHDIVFSEKKYTTSLLMLGQQYSIQLKDACLIGNNATIEIVNNSEMLGAMFGFSNCENLTMRDFIIDGAIARDARIPKSGRHNISIKDSRNVLLTNVRSINALTDGFYINRGENITLDRCVADYNGRQGCSVIAGKRILIKNCSFSHSCRNEPMMGIDIEPNDSYSTELSVVIDSCRFIDNCSSGIGINIGNQVQKDKIGKDKNISITNCFFFG